MKSPDCSNSKFQNQKSEQFIHGNNETR